MCACTYAMFIACCFVCVEVVHVATLMCMCVCDIAVHVYICLVCVSQIRGTSDESLAAGAAKVEKLLIPMSTEERSKSLRELAIINGTYRGDVTCRMCGEQGHIMAQCPKKEQQGKSFMVRERERERCMAWNIT